MVKTIGDPEEMLQVHRGDGLAGLFFLMVLVLAVNISNIYLFISNIYLFIYLSYLFIIYLFIYIYF